MNHGQIKVWRLFKVRIRIKEQRKKMESEILESHLLNKQEEARNPSSFTSGLLLSTSVAVAGSFCYGCAVRFHHLSFLFLLFFCLSFYFLVILDFPVQSHMSTSSKISIWSSIWMSQFRYFPWTISCFCFL